MINAERHHMKQFDDISSIDNFYRAIQEGISEKEALNFVNLRSRDNSRTPMPWDNSQYGGFSNHQPWLAMTEEYPTINAAKNTVLEFYKKMIELRQNSPISPILKTGAIHFLKELPDSIIGYYRELGGEKIYSFTNLSPVSETLIVEKEVEVLYLTSHSMQLLGKEIKLAPYQSILVK